MSFVFQGIGGARSGLDRPRCAQSVSHTGRLPFVSSLTLRRKTRLAELLQEQTEIPWRKAKGYDAIAAYEKRLVTLASGDSVVKAASKAQQAHDRADEPGPDALVPALAPKTPERPRPVRRTRANPDVVTPVQEPEVEPAGVEEAEQQEEEEGNGAQAETMGGQEESPDEPILDAPEASFEIESIPEDTAGQQPAGSPKPQDPVEEPPMDHPASPVASQSPAFSESASPRRLTRASSVLSFGDVQPAKRVRRR